MEQGGCVGFNVRRDFYSCNIIIILLTLPGAGWLIAGIFLRTKRTIVSVGIHIIRILFRPHPLLRKLF
jgi:hypothetical protein